MRVKLQHVAHARSGDSMALAAYMAEGKQFDRAISDYALAYADQSARDNDNFLISIASGRLAIASD